MRGARPFRHTEIRTSTAVSHLQTFASAVHRRAGRGRHPLSETGAVGPMNAVRRSTAARPLKRARVRSSWAIAAPWLRTRRVGEPDALSRYVAALYLKSGGRATNNRFSNNNTTPATLSSVRREGNSRVGRASHAPSTSRASARRRVARPASWPYRRNIPVTTSHA